MKLVTHSHLLAMLPRLQFVNVDLLSSFIFGVQIWNDVDGANRTGSYEECSGK
jgi:hypothetical protein